MLLNDSSLQDNSKFQILLNIIIPDKFLRRIFHGVSRRKRYMWRLRIAVCLLFILLVPVISSGVWLRGKQKKVVNAMLISPLVEGGGGNEGVLAQHAGTAPPPADVKQEEAVNTQDIILLATVPTPFPLTTTVDEVLKKSGIGSSANINDEFRFQIPEHLTPYTSIGTISSRRGEMKARFTADWTNTDTPFIWANFSGNTKINLFEIMGSGQMLFFNNYDEAGVLADSLQVELVNDYKGHEFTIAARWDFDKNPGIKEIVVDGSVIGHEELSFVPQLSQDSRVYAWLVDELEFSDTW